MGDRSSLPPPVEEPPKPPATAASVAQDFFKKELEVKHGSPEVIRSAQTVVIVHDACYGHRYSRPRTSKGALSTIVERPERVHASLLGVATAYVRLGGRHAEGHTPPHPLRDPMSIPAAPFKIHKTPRTLSLRSPAATAVHGKEWMEELTVMCDKAESRLAMNVKELTRENVNGNVNEDTNSEKPKLHEGDLYLCSESISALEGALGGVCEGVDAVFNEKGPKRAFVCIRPPGHHCAADMPSGFCWVNNVHVGIGHAALAHGLTHAAIIDFDLHHGDGSQSITWDHNSRVASMPKNTSMTKKIPIGYFSLHDINSYPCEMGDEEKVRNASLCIENAHGQSIWNVHLQPWKTVSEFWTLYEDRYLVLLAKARAFLKAHSDRLRQSPAHPKPKAIIFLSAGFDASEWESPGMQRHQVHVPTEFYARFTRDVVKMAEEEALGVDGRVVSVLEGGYSDRALMSGVLSHISGLTTKTSLSRPSTSGSNGLGQEMNNRMSSLDLMGATPSRHLKSITKQEAAQEYDPLWWSVRNLEELETLIDPLAHVAPPPKGPRGKVQPTFTLPTESFISKVVEAPQGRRSTSGTARPAPSVIPRGPSPPPPDVYWATAALELRNLLVPSDRETKSCKPEDLNAEATRKRRDRQSNIGELGLPSEERPTDAKPMQLREKRGKASEMKEEAQKAPSRASRRRTIADPNLLAKEDTPPPMPPAVPRPARRRSSVASSIVSVGTMNTDSVSNLSLPGGSDALGPQTLKSTRVPVPLPANVVKPKLAVKRSPVARKPSANSSATTKPAEQVDLNRKSSENGQADNQDVDQLASGMKRMSIKLNVPPKAEYEARETKVKPPSRGRPPKTTTVRTIKAKSPTKAKAKASIEASQPPSFPMQPLQPTQPPPAHDALMSNLAQSAAIAQEADPNLQLVSTKYPQGKYNAAPESAQLEQPPPQTFTSPIPAPDTPKPQSLPSNLDTSSFSNHPPPFSAITPMQPAQPNSPSTPITAKRNTKENLPVFTATSPISFGRPKQEQQQQPSIDQELLREGPNGSSPGRAHAQPTSSDLIGNAFTPHPNGTIPNLGDTTAGGEFQPSSSSTVPQPSALTGLEGGGGGGGGDDGVAGVRKGEEQDSLWDIPDTPRARGL